MRFRLLPRNIIRHVMMPMLPLIRFESSLSMYAKGQEISEYGIIRQNFFVDMRFDEILVVVKKHY